MDKNNKVTIIILLAIIIAFEITNLILLDRIKHKQSINEITFDYLQHSVIDTKNIIRHTGEKTTKEVISHKCSADSAYYVNKYIDEATTEAQKIVQEFRKLELENSREAHKLKKSMRVN